jgi:hypothetical protein
LELTFEETLRERCSIGPSTTELVDLLTEELPVMPMVMLVFSRRTADAVVLMDRSRLEELPMGFTG